MYISILAICAIIGIVMGVVGYLFKDIKFIIVSAILIYAPFLCVCTIDTIQRIVH